MKGRKLLSILTGRVLRYRVVRQDGSHRRMESTAGYPPITFSSHEGDTVGPRLVEKVLMKDVGLTEADAKRVVWGRARS